MNIVTITYILILVFGFLIFFLNFYKYNSNKKLIGTVYKKWSSHFFFIFPLNILGLSLVVIYLYWSFSLIIKAPQSNAGYSCIVFFLFSLSFILRFNNLVGCKGVYLGREIIKWENLKKIEIIDRKIIKYLKLIWIADSGGPRLKNKKVLIPPGDVDYFNLIIAKMKNKQCL